VRGIALKRTLDYSAPGPSRLTRTRSACCPRTTAGHPAIAADQRRSLKNACIRPRHSASRTPATTSKR